MSTDKISDEQLDAIIQGRTDYLIVTGKDKGILLLALEELKAARAEIERLTNALKPFCEAGNYAANMSKKSALDAMDARDYFMWQTSRKLCINDFKQADAAITSEDDK